MSNFASRRRVLRSGVTMAAGLAFAAGVNGAGTASAGGFAVREQSTKLLGSAFAGSAAGGSLGSMFWNSAATAQFPGLNSESNYTIILPDADVTVTQIGAAPPGPGLDTSGFANNNSGDIGIDAVVGASYGAYQISPDAWVGIAINSPFGLATKPERPYLGDVLGFTTKLLTMNANPTLAYRVAPGVTVGVGAQIEYARGKLQFANDIAATSISEFKGTDWAFGATAGVLLEPAAGTTIGLGWRSQLTHDLDGTLVSPLVGGSAPAVGEVKLPDIVTLSLRQAVASNMRLMGTVEWTNWSRFDALTLSLPGGNSLPISTRWSDGWFFSAGGEYDYSSALTLRAGAAYEISPVDAPSKRLTTIPDNDRVWLNIGASYKYSENTTIDFAYSHVFVQDGDFARSPIGGAAVFSGNIDASVDLISIGYRKRW
jgi:long-chain fatty acid transport protein